MLIKYVDSLRSKAVTSATTPKQQPNALAAQTTYNGTHPNIYWHWQRDLFALNCLAKIVFREDGCYGDLGPSLSAVLLIPSRDIGVPNHMVQA